MPKPAPSPARRVAVIAVTAIVVVWFGLRIANRPTTRVETPIERAHRLCEACGLDANEVDRFIDAAGHSLLDREGLVKLWEATYSDSEALEAARELCQPCVDAILDAADQQ